MATFFLLAGLAGLGAYMVGSPAHIVLSKAGVFRQLTSVPLAHPEDLVKIKDTTHCEDIHYYAPANKLFTACEDVSTTRFKWFPPLSFYDFADGLWNAKGSIHVIDAEVRVYLA